MYNVHRVLGTALISTFLVLFGLVAPVFVPSQVEAKGTTLSNGNQGAIWTTNLAGTQNVNHYDQGDAVYLHGSNFEQYANQNLAYTIWTNPPNSTGTDVQSGIVHVAANGQISVQTIWIIPSNAPHGPYKVEMPLTHAKSDNFTVNANHPQEGFHLVLDKNAPETAKPNEIVTDRVTITNNGSGWANYLLLTYKIGPAEYVQPLDEPFVGSELIKSWRLIGNIDGNWVYEIELNCISPGWTRSFTYTYRVNPETPDHTLIIDTVKVGEEEISAGTLILVDRPKADSIQLVPLTATNPVSTSHTVTATVLDKDQHPIEDIMVDFGYRSSLAPSVFNYLGEANTNSQGKASWTMSGPASGQTWTIMAWIENNDNNIIDTEELVSNEVAKIWQAGEGGPSEVAKITLAPTYATNPVSTQHTVIATVYDKDNKVLYGVTVDFGYRSSLEPTAFHYLGEAKTDSQGKASFTMTGPASGQTWIIIAWYEEDNNNLRAETEITSNDSAKTWQAGQGGATTTTLVKPAELPKAGNEVYPPAIAVFASLMSALYGLRGYRFYRKDRKGDILVRLAEID